MNTLSCVPNTLHYLWYLCETICMTIYKCVIFYLFIYSECIIWAIYTFYLLINGYYNVLLLLIDRIFTYPNILFIVVALGMSLYYVQSYLEIILRYKIQQ